jgi:hypothetical protein
MHLQVGRVIGIKKPIIVPKLHLLNKTLFILLPEPPPNPFNCGIMNTFQCHERWMYAFINIRCIGLSKTELIIMCLKNNPNTYLRAFCMAYISPVSEPLSTASLIGIARGTT